MLLLAVDREARDSYVFGWNVRPALWRARIGLGLEKRYTEKHRELGLREGWACVGSFRNVDRYRAIGFEPVRTLSCFAAPGGAPPRPAGWEIRPAEPGGGGRRVAPAPAGPAALAGAVAAIRRYGHQPPWQTLQASPGAGRAPSRCGGRT